MLRRKDRNLVVSGEIGLAREQRLGETWRGLRIAAGAAFRIPDVRRFVAFRAFPDHCGWMIEASADAPLRISFVRPDTGDVIGTRVYSGDFQPLLLPWPKSFTGQMDLVIEIEDAALPSLADKLSGKARKGSPSAFLANHRALSRRWLIDSAVGRGIEIGPGAQPQILPRDGVDVSYLEQMPPQQWNELYNGGGKYEVRPELWDNYIVGDASNLPVADGSIDFLFSSHVFEHLANPIGHLKHWKTKLAPGGKIICVVPDLGGTKDAVQQRSTMPEWLDEYTRDIWSPTAAHYSRHLHRAPDDPQLVATMERHESIHVHYYDNIGCQILLDHAVEELGYADYIIEHTPNHKDFHFVLINR